MNERQYVRTVRTISRVCHLFGYKTPAMVCPEEIDGMAILVSHKTGFVRVSRTSCKAGIVTPKFVSDFLLALSLD